MIQQNDIEQSLLSPRPKIDLPLKSVLTFYMFTLNILAYACYSVIAPFMPLEFARKGIDEEMMGYVMGIFSFAMIVVSPLMGGIIQRIGRRWPIGIGALLMGVSFQLFAVISYLESDEWFLSFSFALRLCQGTATVLI